MKRIKKGLNDKDDDETNKDGDGVSFSEESNSPVASSATTSENVSKLKNEKKQASRRRKGAPKSRRVKQFESSSDLHRKSTEKGRSLDTVLKRVLRAKQEDKESKNFTDKSDKMIKMHETLAMHHHMPKAVRASPTPPESVESPDSVYSNERSEVEPLLESSVEPFVKVRPQSSGDASPTRSPLSGIAASLQRSLSSDAVLRKQSLSPGQVLPKEGEELSGAPESSPPRSSPTSYAYGTSSALVAMAASTMGLPTMIPTNSVMTSGIPSLIPMQRFERRSSAQEKERKSFEEAQKSSPFAPGSFPITSIGSGGPAMQSTSASSPPTPEMRAQYKRPPHTYPALIASAILDSPGNLITLRGIYEYIMNNFPYYKYCHDKSAWQNSIRHNLSLNQCFVKVPRYENAAKSNYWTMTREGFDEFGNENSFKRRRRRGASLAPISAYRAKKQQSEGSKNSGKNKPEQRNPSSVIVSASTSGVDSAPSERFDVTNFPPHLMSLAASGVWASGFRPEDINSKSRKRSPSPPNMDGAKLPRMMVLKQGDGPSLDGIKSDDLKRPNSLSSVEEMQGALNFFSKTLAKSSASSPILSSASQPWMSAAQKTLIASSLMSGETEKADRLKDNEKPLLVDGIEVGSETTVRFDASTEVPIRQYRCRFCPYTYVSASNLLMEQHIRMVHQFELSNAKSRGASNAITKESSESQKEAAERLLTIPSMIPGLNSRSMLAAAQTNAQNLLAAAQASASVNGPSSYPYSASFSSGLVNDSVIRSFAEQAHHSGSGIGDRDPTGLSGMDAYAYRQQALNSALQQAAAASSVTSQQEQLRMLYQQLALSNSLFANSANSAMVSAFPRQNSPTASDHSNQLKQQFWQQYQQKIFDQMKVLSDDSVKGNDSLPRRNSNQDGIVPTSSETSPPRRSPVLNTGAEIDFKKGIHGWKQCTNCDFTAKGEHGLELHYRKAHARPDATLTSSAAEGVPSSDVGDNQSQPSVDKAMSTAESCSIRSNQAQSRSASCDERPDAKILSTPFLTSPLSNSPSHQKRSFNPLDLSEIKREEPQRTFKSNSQSSSTQTTTEQAQCDPTGNRTCHHCDISFGDDMMHALHMSCHDKVDPFKCTICGQKCNEKYYFNVHLLRGLHQKPIESGHGPVFEADSVKSDAERSYRRHSNSSNDSGSSLSRFQGNADAADSAYQ